MALDDVRLRVQDAPRRREGGVDDLHARVRQGEHAAVRVLHAEPHVVQGHPGGWLAADDGAGASWSVGLGSAADVVDDD